MYDGYPVVTRENGMICAKTYLYDKVLVCCQTDPNPPKPTETDKPDNTNNKPIWYSAREMRAEYDKLVEWQEAANIC